MAPSSGSANPSIPAWVCCAGRFVGKSPQKVKRREKQTNSISSIFPSFSSCSATKQRSAGDKVVRKKRLPLCNSFSLSVKLAPIMLCVSLAGRPLDFFFFKKNPTHPQFSWVFRFVLWCRAIWWWNYPRCCTEKGRRRWASRFAQMTLFITLLAPNEPRILLFESNLIYTPAVRVRWVLNARAIGKDFSWEWS